MNEPQKQTKDLSGPDSPHFQLVQPDVPLVAGEPLAAWEEVEAGRFMPRRVRGSYQGRALG
jgi:hypothetical protein